jgi:hypothetical protein
MKCKTQWLGKKMARLLRRRECPVRDGTCSHHLVPVLITSRLASIAGEFTTPLLERPFCFFWLIHCNASGSCQCIWPRNERQNFDTAICCRYIMRIRPIELAHYTEKSRRTNLIVAAHAMVFINGVAKHWGDMHAVPREIWLWRILPGASVCSDKQQTDENRTA